MQFKIDLKIFLFLLLFYFTNQVETYVLILIFAIIHELGHLLAGLLLGMKPKSLELKPYGVSISFNIEPKDYNRKILKGNMLEIKKIIVAIAGPLTNLIIIFITMQFELNIFMGMMIVYANLLLAIFNLLPICPLDGGRILKGFLHIIFGKRKAEMYINYISLISLIVLTFISSIGVFYLQNIAIFLVIIVLWILYIREDIIYRRKNKIYNLVEKSIEIDTD